MTRHISQINCEPYTTVFTQGYEGELEDHPSMTYSNSLDIPVFEIVEGPEPEGTNYLIFTPPPEEL